MNRKDYDKAMCDILEENSKFRKLKKDPTLLKEGQLQRFIRTLKKQGVFDDNTYEIYILLDHNPLSYMALLSFINPLLMFLLSVLLFHL